MLFAPISKRETGHVASNNTRRSVDLKRWFSQLMNISCPSRAKVVQHWSLLAEEHNYSGAQRPLGSLSRNGMTYVLIQPQNPKTPCVKICVKIVA